MKAQQEGVVRVLTCPAIVASMLLAFVPSKSFATPVTFDFDNQTPPFSTPFSTTVDGITATFASNNPSEPFTRIDLFHDPYNFSQLALYSIDTLGVPHPVPHELTITFSPAPGSPSIQLSQLEFDFLIGITAPSSLIVEAFESGVLVGSQTFTGTVIYIPDIGPYCCGPTEAFGHALFAPGTPFDTVTLSVAERFFGIDNLTAIPVPEPGSLVLIGSGMLLLWRRLHDRQV